MKKLFLLVLIGSFSACMEKKEIPKDILPKSVMTSLLIEKHISETRAASQSLTADSAKALYDALQNIVYKKHQVDSAKFNRSFRYYSEHVEDLDQIYATIVDSLSLREATGKMD